MKSKLVHGYLFYLRGSHARGNSDISIKYIFFEKKRE